MITNGNGIFSERISINPTYCFAYIRNLYPIFRFHKLPEKNTNQGQLSLKSITRIRKAINWMLFFAQQKTVYDRKKKSAFKFRINFITLTLSSAQQHPDVFILHHMLFPFLKYLERKHEVTAYVWRAEIQPMRLKKKKERCIHFHITLDKFVHWRAIKNKWNELQLRHGYRKPGENPNSTDVHSVQNTEEIIGYMSKYIAKQVKKKELAVQCKIFGMSRNLSQMKLTLVEEDLERYHEIVGEYLDARCYDAYETDYGKMYLTHIDKTVEPSGIIREAYEELYQQYTKGIISEIYYEVN